MLTRSAATGFGGTSWRSQLSKSTSLSCSRRHCDPWLQLGAAVGPAWRGSHEPVEPRILELEARGATRRAHVVGAADRRQRVQVQAVHHEPRHHVDPAVGHRKLAALEIELERPCEGLHVATQLALERGECRRQRVHAAQRAVRGVAARVARGGPALAGDVVLAGLQALVQQARVECPPARGGQASFIDHRRKQRAGRHGGRIPETDAIPLRPQAVTFACRCRSRSIASASIFAIPSVSRSRLSSARSLSEMPPPCRASATVDS